ncbi:Mu transposase C-terminal domain-containing protein [Hydrogenophaga sp. BPS33]|uniref:Mu transposase C-terminal domain-containing protein n=1 Tax=Hydrogenophaga sp. BPS33 TaxID=2651974 RepID=UPI0013579618|nr:Mu transposase C-terminal domain-containing protein [Hydrogenophaga sp. BPS33]
MRNSSFDVGSEFCLRGKNYRVTSATKQRLVLEDIKAEEVEVKKRSELVAAYKEGHLVFSDLLATASSHLEEFQLEKSLSDFSARVKSEAAGKLHYLRSICPRGHVLFSRRELRQKLKECHAELPKELLTPRAPSIATFYEWRSRWMRSGYQTRSLVNRYDLRGRKCDETNPRVMPFLEQAIEETFLKPNHPTVAETLDHANGLIEKSNLNVPPIDAIPRATRTQIIREIGKLERKRVLEKRYGKAHAEAATGVRGKKAEPEGLLDRVEVDHTPLDLIALTSKGGFAGRPNLTVLIDVATRMILGIWISFQPPNSGSVLRALRVAILPKDDLMRKLRIKSEYDAHGVPLELVLDNGLEFHGNDLEGAALDLQIKVVYCPRRQPRFKGVVENWLKQINYRFMHLQPGTTLDRYFKRNELDPYRDAVIPLEDLKRFIWKWIAEVYSRRFHRGLQTCPREKWSELAKLGPPVLPKRMDVVTFYTSPIHQRMLSSKGIEINCQFYRCDELAHVRAVHGNLELQIRPDLDDLGKINVLHPDTQAYFEAFSTNPSYANGLSIEEDKWIRQLAREKYSALDHETAMLLAKQEIREEVAAMQKEKIEGADKPKARASRKTAKTTSKRTPKAVHVAASVSKAIESVVLDAEASPPQVTPKRMPNFAKLKAFPSGQSPLF